MLLALICPAFGDGISDVGVGHPSLASEFPNDNAEISSGTIWIHPDLIGPPVAELAPFEPVPAESFVLYFDDEELVEGPVEVEAVSGTITIAVGMHHEAEPELGLQPDPEVDLEPELDLQPAPDADLEPESASPASDSNPPDSPALAHFERALSGALLAQGATRSAALVSRLLRLEPLLADDAAKDVWLSLQSRGYLDDNGRYSPKYRELCGAWSALLQGASQDFSACGTTTLDRFGADLLAALLAVPASRAEELRRELRKAGIAAFGVLAAA